MDKWTPGHWAISVAQCAAAHLFPGRVRPLLILHLDEPGFVGAAPIRIRDFAGLKLDFGVNARIRRMETGDCQFDGISRVANDRPNFFANCGQVAVAKPHGLCSLRSSDPDCPQGTACGQTGEMSYCCILGDSLRAVLRATFWVFFASFLSCV